LANGMIPKPTYWTFVFFKALFPTAIARNERFVVTKSDNGDLRGIAWNPVEVQSELPLRLLFDIKNGAYLLVVKTVDEIVCNPLKTWLDMGSPAYPTKKQLELLRDCSTPQITTKRIDVADNSACIDIVLAPNALIFFELERIEPETDRGFVSSVSNKLAYNIIFYA